MVPLFSYRKAGQEEDMGVSPLSLVFEYFILCLGVFYQHAFMYHVYPQEEVCGCGELESAM